MTRQWPPYEMMESELIDTRAVAPRQARAPLSRRPEQHLGRPRGARRAHREARAAQAARRQEGVGAQGAVDPPVGRARRVGHLGRSRRAHRRRRGQDGRDVASARRGAPLLRAARLSARARRAGAAPRRHRALACSCRSSRRRRWCTSSSACSSRPSRTRSPSSAASSSRSIEPVLAELLPYYEKDEARHVGLGVHVPAAPAAPADAVETAGVDRPSSCARSRC